MSEPYPDGPLARWLRNDAPLLSLEVGADDQIVVANPYTSDLLGKTLDGVHFRDVIVDFSESLDPRALSEVGGGARRLSISTVSGPPRDYLCSFIALPRTTWILGVPDTVEEEALGAQVLALNRDLNNLTRSLQKANAELEELNQLKNQFLGMATHDLRKPLGLIMGFTELVQEEAEDRLLEEEKDYLDKVIKWAEAMKKLVDDFLDISVIESGRLAMEVQWVELPSVVDRARTVAAIQADLKGVELRVMEDPAIPPLSIDAARLDQVLVNLLSNAIDFSYEGSWVELRTLLEGDHVIMEVRDQGVGMDEEDMKRLFSPFGKAKAKKTGGESSTGLGLMISRRIVESHGGRISVESKVGEGSVFRVSLPVGDLERKED